MRTCKHYLRLVSLLIAMLAIPAVAFATTYSGDLAISANATSNSDSGTMTKTKAFDDDISTRWQTNSSAATCVSAGAYIGQDFGAGSAPDIRRFTLKQVNGQSVSSVIVRYSDDNSVYSTAEVVTVVSDNSWHTYDIGEYSGHRYWRIQCNSIPASDWSVSEVEMFSILADTPTPTGTPASTATPTITPTPSTTPSPTPNYFIQITSTSGAPMALERTATFGDVTVFGGLLFVGGMLFITFAYNYWRERINASVDV